MEIPAYFLQILIYFLLFEIGLVVLLLLVTILVRSWNRHVESRDYLLLRKIAQAILDFMKGKSTLDEVVFLNTHTSKKLLLKEMEIFNQRFSGKEWDRVKEDISRKYLLEFAKKNVKSRNWVNRSIAARCFALCPLDENRDEIISLMDDPVFLVRSFVIEAIVHLKFKEGIIKILEHMSRELGYAHYYYRDALIDAKDSQILEWIAEEMVNSDVRNFQLVCLEVLSGKMQHLPENFLLRDIKSSDAAIRLAAIRVYAHNPQKDSGSVLLSHTIDSNKEMRKEAMYGLSHFRSRETLVALEKGLSDCVWEVRLQAALSLRNMGNAGRQILEKQSPELDIRAFEAANFCLEIKW